MGTHIGGGKWFSLLTPRQQRRKLLWWIKSAVVGPLGLGRGILGPQGSGRRVGSWDPGALQRGERCGPGTARAPESGSREDPALLFFLPVPAWS